MIPYTDWYTESNILEQNIHTFPQTLITHIIRLADNFQSAKSTEHKPRATGRRLNPRNSTEENCDIGSIRITEMRL